MKSTAMEVSINLGIYDDNYNPQKIQIHIDADLEDMIPGYLANRYKNVAEIHQALADSDYEMIRIAGHSMKGSGGGYGFDAITDFGAALELAAKNKDTSVVHITVINLKQYLDKLEVVYEEFN
jgi:HPt (histidine-containing phosphotransfer) domain-containing protein